MIDTRPSLDAEREYAEFEYRLVYLRPSAYSDERLAVGLVANGSDHLETRFVSSPESIDLMTRLVGTEGVEQFQFAVSAFRRTLACVKSLDSICIPTDLLMAGEKIAAYTCDRKGLLASVLTSASCLVSFEAPRNTELPSSASAMPFTKDLFDHVTRLNPLVAHDLFDRKVTIDTGQTVELPILGNRIFGAPVSCAARDSRIRGESYVAQFVWLRQHLRQVPRVYLLSPHDGHGDVSAKVNSSVRELQAVAEASKMPLKMAESTAEMATVILQDEAA